MTEADGSNSPPVEGATAAGIELPGIPAPEVGQSVARPLAASPVRAATDGAPGTAPLVLEREAGHSGLDIPPYVLDGSVVRIGRVSISAASARDPLRELVLSHSSVSRQHATITGTTTGFVLRDAGSSNGTFVNGFRLGEFPIKNGDRVRFGDLRFVVRDVDLKRGADPDSAERSNESRATVPTTVELQDRVSGDWTSVPGLDSCAFGAIIVTDYDELRATLSEIGAQRLETSLGRIVAQLIDAGTYAFRSIVGSTLQIVLVVRSVAHIDALTSQIGFELQRWLADAALEHRNVKWSTSTVDPVVAIRRVHAMPIPAPTVDVTARKPSDELRWVHISDLHFGAGTVSWRYDHEQVMTSLIRDLHQHPFAAHRILVTGDVAFSGSVEQYELALEALRRVAAAVGLPLGGVRVVPGNHDVDRANANTPLVAALHHHARSSSAVLDTMLADARSRTILLEKLCNYRAFIARLDGHPGELDWRERLTVAGACIDLWGLSSVWISDSMDGRGERDAFAANLVVGRMQYRELARDLARADMNLVMTHHPLEWISADHGRWLRSAFASTPSVHLCGHVHKHVGAAIMRLGKLNHHCTLVAGASHSEEGEIAGHSYSRCVLRRELSGQWTLGWSPRVYDPERDAFRSDHGAHDLDADGYAWLSLPAVVAGATQLSAR